MVVLRFVKQQSILPDPRAPLSQLHSVAIDPVAINQRRLAKELMGNSRQVHGSTLLYHTLYSFHYCLIVCVLFSISHVG